MKQVEREIFDKIMIQNQAVFGEPHSNDEKDEFVQTDWFSKDWQELLGFVRTKPGGGTKYYITKSLLNLYSFA